MQTEADKRISSRSILIDKFKQVRSLSEKLTNPLKTEDFVVQPIEDVSPPKWHLGHTSWLFEEIVLKQFDQNFKPFNPKYNFIFNSYYESLGSRVLRSDRGSLSRPTVEEVFEYRNHVTNLVISLIESIDENKLADLTELVMISINHEQQHQELFITDIKYIYAANPLLPTYNSLDSNDSKSTSIPFQFVPVEGGLIEIGAEGNSFAYDNEYPKHKVYLEDFKIANRTVTCGEYLEFISDGSYNKPLLWLSDGWDKVKSNNWDSPLYWIQEEDSWKIMTLHGLKDLDLNEPLCHVSYFEAAAYARWAGKRLPTEFEWEQAAPVLSNNENGLFLEDSKFHPTSRYLTESMLGNVWEWTSSAYLPYPGYKQSFDALGEYNGKFMNAQMVLRGGSCATPKDHIRATYRNFFQSDKRWQFSGIRLASNV